MKSILEPPQEGKLEPLLHRIEVLLEQVDHLYRLYAEGVEKTPPFRQRTLLEGLMRDLHLMQKSNLTEAFRSSGVQARYQTYQQRWDKLLKSIERGG